MAKPAELPQLVTELVDMSKAYLQQETVEPLKRLGRYAGCGVLLAVGWLLLVIALLRWTTDLLPEGAIWEVLAYAIAAIVSLMIAGVSLKLAAGSGRKDGHG